jgi:hypothetical protein
MWASPAARARPTRAPARSWMPTSR